MDRSVGIGDPEFLSALVGEREEATNPASHSVLGHLRVGETAELLKGCMTVLNAEVAGVGEVLWDIVAKNLHRAIYTGCGGCGSLCGASLVRVVEVGVMVGAGPLDAGLPFLVPLQAGARCANAGEQDTDCFPIANEDAFLSSCFFGLGGDR